MSLASRSWSVTWRGAFADDALNALHAEAFEHRLFDDDWNARVERHSLGWVVASDATGLVGFANVVWDGGVHTWLQDVVVASRSRRQGVATALVKVAKEQSAAAGCEWLHVDFDDKHEALYIDACGFVPTAAGLIELS